MEPIFEKVKAFIVKQLEQVDPSQITTETSLVGDLGASPIDLVEIMTYLQAEFDIAVPLNEPDKIKTVGDIVQFLKSRYFG